ncbi:ABC transporter, ATP-binding protein [Prevotella bivia JCVIHMP010]|uniref:ABC-type multidrug transport system, ATPase and permease component n=3 Tax=Prevotella bivia TaxID=28125 RepID=I4Z8J9_9BACT|nr:ABC transporter, ATP-binding protein [Prevotella bivia JCVIHMP010]EIM32541.1 ABC-type multidrug transport system, ATPase and permease component [Prevotella bivia DSM 20514]KXO18315.1 ABC transporter, ATP-binding protein [Prevotella bivia]
MNNMNKKLKNLLRIPETKYSTKEIYAWLWLAWKGNRTQAMINAIIGLLGVMVSLTVVWGMQHAIDVSSHVISGSIVMAVVVLGILFFADFGLHVASIWVRNLLGIKAQNRMQQQLLDRMLRSEWKGRDSYHSGDVLNRLEFDVTNVVTFLTETIPNSLSTLTLFIGAFTYLALMDWRLAIVIIAMVPFFILLSRVYVRQMRRLVKDVRTSDSKVQSVLQESIQHRVLIKTLESDDFIVNRLETTQNKLRKKVVKKTKFSIFSSTVLQFGFVLGYLIAFAWAAFRLSAGTLTFGGMTAFLQLVNKIQSPARQLTQLVPAFVSVFTAAERLMELEEVPLEKQGDAIELEAPCGIKLNNISYQYFDADTPVIKDLSFDFHPGSCTAVLGETGSGKTTLIRILLALLKPTSGSVEIYGREERMELNPLMRTNFVYVPQGNTLMSGTIRENLKMGKENATEEEMNKALKKSCADFVLNLPNGLDTVCSEQGGGLSEGQAQRIAIARSLLRDKSIMIFDEATSALDPETEKQLLKNILAHHDKTVIFITHRPAVVEYCNQVLTIEKI